jgi:predicted transposase YbfD/YdcC
MEGLQSLICIESERSMKGNKSDQVERETRYYISSLKPESEKIGKAIRAHWRIENNLHWRLDITFRENESRIRKGNAPENFACVRRLSFFIATEERR